MKSTDIAIIGGSVGGLVAAVTSKKRNPEKSVTVIRNVMKSMVPCGIPYIYGTLKAVEKDQIPDQKFLDMGIEIVCSDVASIDRDNKALQFRDGEALRYDKLIVATGSKPFVPPIKGVALDNVFVVEKDPVKLQSLYNALETAKNVIVIGGGFIGVEMAEQITVMKQAEKDTKVTIVEMLPHCLMMACEEEFCVQVENELTESGINIVTGQGVKEIRGGNQVTSVLLADGTELSADLVLISAGAKPNAELAEKCGLKTDPHQGIVVNEYMQTNDPDIFAAGDCASKTAFITGKPSGIRLASVASSEGMIAASNLYNEVKRKSMGALGAFATKVGPHSIASAGLTTKAAEEEGIEVVVGEAVAPNRHPGNLPGCVMNMKAMLLFRKDNGKIVGGHVIGGESAADMVNAISVAIQAGNTMEELATMQYATHPLLTASPTAYHIMLAAENGAIKLKRLQEKQSAKEALTV
ncbi:FAD-dependent oxidoreductase [Vibrio sp. JC009]|uniref:FAD-dependent oxidoreductase n=1 Tax=Vibrio sp. JC009 TaxID=2912314 RepID=UPI0023B1B062|nr:FAD-dependent oxidoreductase [Vibrio sp. JC009]WED24659.1 FAD-dependent oxidoreductase [Vibrio sp. JC009]